MSINTRPEDYRNGEILRLRKDSLTTISFNYPDSAIVLTKEGARWYKGDAPADSANAVKYVNALSYVTSKSFTEESILGTPELNVTFGFSNQPEIQVSAYRKPQGWVIQSSENADEIWVDQAAFDKLFVASSQF